MKYMLDTNICVFLLRNQPEVIKQYFEKRDFGIAISTIVLAELRYGASNSSFPDKNGERLDHFLIGLELLDFDAAAAEEYGNIRAALRKRAILIGEMDLLIAAHTKSASLTLVTNNQREFSRVDGLLLEDWLSQG